MGRRLIIVLALGMAAASPFPILGAGAQTSSGDVRAESEGWWDALSGAGSVPGNPLGGMVPRIPAPAPDVPEGVVPVAMRLGQESRVGAIGIVFDVPKGSTVNSLVMTLKESEESGAQQGSDGGVLACPITSFLVPQENGSARDAPEQDCDLASAEGERADDGTWTFDLTAIGVAWADPFGTVPASGVRLNPVGDAPATFQVGFTGFEDATFEADIVAGSAPDPFATGGDLGGSAGPSFDAGSGVDFAGPGADSPTVPTATGPTGGDAGAGNGAGRPTAPTSAISRVGDTLGNFPLSGVVAVLATVVGAVLAGLSLGTSARRREPALRRQGGISRALAGRSTTSKPRHV